jgi:hypothetical protein
MQNFDLISSLAIVLLAALTHASFQLSVSMLTLLSGHALGSKSAHLRLMRLTGGFILGAAVMTVLLLSTISLVLNTALPVDTPMIIWAACSGAVVGVGVSVWLFYFRKGPGTSLWIPRNFANYMAGRSKSTKLATEAFGLGLSSIFAELLFTFAPMAIASLVLIRLSPNWQLIGIGLYALVSLLPLLIVWLLIGGGHKLSHIQHWRESNKYFLQFVAGSGLLILGAYVYVERVMVAGTAALGVQ